MDKEIAHSITQLIFLLSMTANCTKITVNVSVKVRMVKHWRVKNGRWACSLQRYNKHCGYYFM